MRLTVGPLPPAVYWRRRAVVLAALSIVVLVMFYACGGARAPAGPQLTSARESSQPAPGKSTMPSVLTPVSGKPPVTLAPTSAAPTAFTLPTTGPTSLTRSGPCGDDEITVTASASASKVAAGKPIDFTIKIQNAGSRSCSRDIGADAQELRLLDAQTIIWSSDDCAARHGSDVHRFRPGDAVTFTLTWNGRRSRTGTGAVNCASPPVPAIAAYALLGRLDTSMSAPFALRIT